MVVVVEAGLSEVHLITCLRLLGPLVLHPCLHH
jgi:hypothetical protein